MLNKLGYTDVHEAFDGQEAVRVVDKLMKERRAGKRKTSNVKTLRNNVVDVILMDLWMPIVDGYQATEQIFEMFRAEGFEGGVQDEPQVSSPSSTPPTILAVSADVTDAAIDKATKIGMSGYMSKPFKVLDLQKLILEFCVRDLVPAVAIAA